MKTEKNGMHSHLSRLGIDPLKVFSPKAVNYQYRPRYPAALFDLLQEQCSLSPDHIVADLGSGTGFLTGVFLDHVRTVYAVEPNPEMRRIAEGQWGGSSGFVSLVGTAENIPLPANSADMVSIGQALHWFDVRAARLEILRILRSSGWVVVVDNVMQNEASPFMQSYQKFRELYFADIGTASDPPEKIVRLFNGADYRNASLPNPFKCAEQVFRAGILSSSIAPLPGSDHFDDFESALHDLFSQYQTDGQVEVLFDTVVWMGKLK